MLTDNTDIGDLPLYFILSGPGSCRCVVLMLRRQQVLLSCLCAVAICLTLLGSNRHLSLYNEQTEQENDRGKDRIWPTSSSSKTQLCSLFRICVPADWQSRIHSETNVVEDQELLEDIGYKGRTQPNKLTDDQRTMREIPRYVLDYAPLVHLYSGEQFWPSDIAEHLGHVTPNLNYTPIQAASTSPNLTDLDKLNEYSRGRYIYLKSDDNVEERPDWLVGKKNIPNASYHEYASVFKEKHKSELPSGRSDAPAVLIVVNKGHGIVDAFWFYFYSYNLGNVVLNVRFGNHVGDWEHSLIRFHNGKPKVVFFSEHNFGSAYSYSAVEKIGQRVSIQHDPSIIQIYNC